MRNIVNIKIANKTLYILKYGIIYDCHDKPQKNKENLSRII